LPSVALKFFRYAVAASTLTSMLTGTVTSLYLTKPQKNRIYETMAQTGLNPAQCKLELTDYGFWINHNTGSAFRAFLITEGLRHYLTVNFRFGKPGFRLVADVRDGSSWQRIVRVDVDNFIEALLPSIADWAVEVKRIMETPDHWADMKQNQALITSIQGDHDADNTPFTQDERKQIAAQLQALKEQLKEQSDLTSEQIAHIGVRLDEAAEAAGRMGRKDWLLLFGGTILNLIVTDTVTPDVAGHIFRMAINGLIHLFSGGPPHIIAT
jgi:hypothetical protein